MGSRQASKYRGDPLRGLVPAVSQAARPALLAGLSAPAGIFEGALALADGVPARPVSPERRLATLERHVELIAGSAPDGAQRVRELRRYASAYSKGLPGGRHFRVRAMELDDPEALVALTRRFLSEGAWGREAA